MSVSRNEHALHGIGYPQRFDSQQTNPSNATPHATPPVQSIAEPESRLIQSNQRQLPLSPPIGARSGLVLNERANHLLTRAYAETGPEAPSRQRGKRALADTPTQQPRNTLGRLGTPMSQSVEADKTLQAALIKTMGSSVDATVTVPPRSLISQPFEIYKRVVNQPEVLAWLREKGFSLDSVVIGSNGMSGMVRRNGVVSHQTYTLQDTSGWWQVSARVMRALEAIDPKHQGMPYVVADSQQISRNVASAFYGISAPRTEEEAAVLAQSLMAGWPALSPAHIGNHRLRLEWAKRGINERDDRENLADALQQAAQGLADDAPLSLSDTEFDVSRTHPLTNDDAARQQLSALVALPEMRDFLAELGETLPDQPVRISEGRLQVLHPESNQWLSVPVSERGSHALKDALAAVVALSTPFGSALYSDDRHDLRQVARSMNLDVLETAAHASAAANWLRTDFAPPPAGGNFARLLPQVWAPGSLSESDKSTLAALATDQRYGANTIGYAWGNRIVTQVDPQETAAKADEIWEQLLNTPQAQEWGRELAMSLDWYNGTANADIDAVDLKALVISTIMLSVDPNVPATPGSAAGYQFYTPANMGREMGAVRKDFEKQLIEKKGVSVRAASLVAHLFLAHAAPEFLIKADQQESNSIPESLRVSPDKIRIGSPAWMTLSLGTALAEVWGGAGASRGMSVKELGALTSLEPVLPQQQELVVALGAKVVINVGVMTGAVPLRSDAQYTLEDYQAASESITRRTTALEQSIETLGAAPPTRSSLAIKALKLAFPELTDSEIETITLRKPATTRNSAGMGLNPKAPTLVEAYATGDLHEGWFGFSHPRITQAEFEARVKALPIIADHVSGAVDQYRSDVKAAMPALMKMTLANLPLDVRQALEWGKVDVYRLRRETGETQPQDAAKGNKVAENRGWHGVLLRVQCEGKTRYLEFFPTSGTIIDSTARLSGKALNLNEGVIEEERVPAWRSGTRVNRYLRGTPQPFDFDAYVNGTVPRGEVSSKVIISKVGDSIQGATLRGQGDKPSDWVPDTFGSAKSQSIIDTILNGNYVGDYSGHRQELIDSANALLPSEDNVQGYFNRLMSKENGRALVSMISFIGPLVDIYDGNVKEGLKNLAIDSLFFIGAGGLQASRKAWKAIRFASRLNWQMFRSNVLKEGTGLLRGIFNPVEGFFSLPSQPGRFGRFLSRAHRGIPTSIGMGVYVPADIFAKYRFSRDATPSLFEMLKKAKAAPVVPVQGTVNQVPVQAIRQQNNWYAIDPTSGLASGPPLQGFVPETT